MPFFQADPASIYYETFGEGDRPMLLLHGTTGRSTSFSPIVPRLQSNATLYIPDLRGHGQSSHVPNGYRVLDFAADLYPFIENEIGQPTIVLGHSLGGLVAIAIAAARPDLVAALIVEDAPLWLRRSNVKDGSERAYQFFKSLYKLCLETQNENEIGQRIRDELPHVAARESADLPARLAQLDPDLLKMSFDSSLMAGFDIDHALSQISCPSLIVQADIAQGGSLADEDAKAVVGLLSKGHLVAVPGSGHLIHRDRPVALATIIEGWLGTLGG